VKTAVASVVAWSGTAIRLWKAMFTSPQIGQLKFGGASTLVLWSCSCWLIVIQHTLKQDAFNHPYELPSTVSAEARHEWLCKKGYPATGSSFSLPTFWPTTSLISRSATTTPSILFSRVR